MVRCVLFEPVEVAAPFDFGLTPRHLKNSGTTLFVHEKDDPRTAPLLMAFAKAVAEPKPEPAPGQPEQLSFCKCNMNSIVGDGATAPWPVYTSRLDIEPELAVVYGNEEQPVAGFCIFNDVSARDVQVPEMVGGFRLTKDMAKGNQLGPHLVTLDEVGDPYDLKVLVRVNGHPRYEGSTCEIAHKAEDVFAWLRVMAPIAPGSVTGFGTIPDCTGLDHGDFINAGAEIQIDIEKLGTLRCSFEEPQALLPSRWPVRPSLLKYHKRPGADHVVGRREDIVSLGERHECRRSRRFLARWCPVLTVDDRHEQHADSTRAGSWQRTADVRSQVTGRGVLRSTMSAGWAVGRVRGSSVRVRGRVAPRRSPSLGGRPRRL